MLMGSSVHGFSLVHGCIDAWVRGLFGSRVHRTQSDQLFREQYQHKCKYTEEHICSVCSGTHASYICSVCFGTHSFETTAATTCWKVREEDKYDRALMDLLIMRVLWSTSLRAHVQTNVRTIINASPWLPCGRMFWNIACVAKTERGGCAPSRRRPPLL